MLPLKIQNVLGSIPSSSDTVESEVRHMKQSKISFIKNIKTIPLYYSTRIYYNRECPKNYNSAPGFIARTLAATFSS
jgi:hypothetical protein